MITENVSRQCTEHNRLCCSCKPSKCIFTFYHMFLLT